MKHEWIGEMDFRTGMTAGMYLSDGQMESYTVLGITVRALNFLHAEHQALKQLLQNDYSRYIESGQCDHCGAHILYVIVLRGEDGKHIAVGADCAGYLESNFDRNVYLQHRKEREIKQARNGNFFHSRAITADWVWDIYKSVRPQWMSVSKSKNGRKEQWYMFVWGASREEVMLRLGDLQSLQVRRYNKANSGVRV